MKALFSIFILMSVVKSAKATSPGGVPAPAQMCFACHGQGGLSQNDLWPNLAGQKQGYLLKQLTAFKSGERKDPMMSPVANNLSDEEIKLLTQYFSHL